MADNPKKPVDASSKSSSAGPSLSSQGTSPASPRKAGTPASQGAKRKLSNRTGKPDEVVEEATRPPTGKKDQYGLDLVDDVASPSVSSDEDSPDEDEVGDIPQSRPVSKQDMLERKPTLDPEFMKRLTVPDNENESESGRKLFETNQAVRETGRGSSFSARKTGFDTWLQSKTSAKHLYGEDSVGKVLLVYRNLSVNVESTFQCIPQSVRTRFQGCFRDFLALGVDDKSQGYSVLKSLSGVMYAGKTTLVLGPPGAGTTTLLRTLSGRLNERESVSYDLLKNDQGDVKVREWLTRRRCAYVSADDRSHIPVLTVQETMDFAARLTMAAKESQGSDQHEADLNELVHRVVESLGLSEQTNTIIGGDDLRGVSGGQKRRCTLGEMLFSRDAKLLFLDDITNGLDASKAQQVMRIIRSACRILGFSAMVSLLQPNDMLFDAFDDLMVLSSRGEMIFSGPTTEAIPYFENLLERVNETNKSAKDWTRPSGMSSAEFILMAVYAIERRLEDKSSGELSMVDQFLQSRDGEKLKESLEEAEKQLANVAVGATKPLPNYATSEWTQLKVLVKRRALLISRNPMTLRRIIVAIAFGLVIGTLFGSLNQDLLAALGRTGFLFLTLFLVLMLSTAVTVPDNHALRLVFVKQYGSGFHSAGAFYLSNFICDMPLAVIEAFLLSVIPYWWVGLRTSDAGGFFYFFAILVAMEFVGQAASRVVSALSPTVLLAQLIASGLILGSGLVAGFMPHYQALPPWWQWLNWITPVSYALEGLVLNNYVAGGQGNASYPALTVTEPDGTQVNLGMVNGTYVASAMGQPRIGFSSASAGLNDAGKVMAFDFGMLLVFAICLDLAGLLALIKSHQWYEPWSRRSIQTTSAKATAVEVKEVLKSVSTQFMALKNEEFGAQEITTEDNNGNVAEGMKKDNPLMPQDVAPAAIVADKPLPTAQAHSNDLSSDEPMELCILEMSYFVTDSSHVKKREESKADASKADASKADASKAPNAHSGEGEQALISADAPASAAFLQAKASASLQGNPSRNSLKQLNGQDGQPTSKSGPGPWLANYRFMADARTGENLRLSFVSLYTAILFKLNLFGGKARPQPGPLDPGSDASDVLPPEERIHLNVHRPRSGSKRGRAWSNKLPYGEEEGPAAAGGAEEGEIQLLHEVTAVFRTGEMTALMGPSGCGKTTLLDLMAGYKTAGRIRGDIFVNGNKVNAKDLHRFLGYAEQTDLHMPVLSVYESLMFSASCRLPGTYDQVSIRKVVDEVMDVLQLREFSNVVVGLEDSSEGLAKHARRRLTIGVELVGLPRILLLDEPTTGLDSLGAEIVTGAIAAATKKMKIAVVATIHQPSRAVFGRFDRLLFLQKGGHVLYHGPISSFKPFDETAQVGETTAGSMPRLRSHGSGSKDWQAVHVIQRQPSGLQPILEDQGTSVLVADMRPAPTIADTVLAYFAGMGAPPLKQGFNPADHLLIAVDTLEENGVDVADLYNDSKEKMTVWEEIRTSTKSSRPFPMRGPGATYPRQLRLLLWRSFLSQWRDPKFTVFKLFWYILGAMFIGTIFIQLGCSVQDGVYRIAALFFAVYTAIVPMQVAVIPLVKERAVVYRETASGTYSAWMDALARFLVDIPFHAVLAVVFYAIFYYAVGLSPQAEKTGYFILMLFFTYWMLTSFGQAVAMVSPNIETANGLAGLVILLSTFLMGFLIPVKLMPAGWRWAVWVNMLYYILQGLCVNELGDQMLQLNLGNTTLPCGPMPSLNLTIPSLPTTGGVSIGPVLGSRPSILQSKYDGLLRGSLLPVENGTSQVTAPFNCTDLIVETVTDLREWGACLEENKCVTVAEIITCSLNPFRCGSQWNDLLASLLTTIACLPAEVVAFLLRVIPCLLEAKTPEEVLACFPRVQELVEFLEKFLPVLKHLVKFFQNNPAILTWLIYILAYQTIFIPANIILYFFGWAQRNPDGTGIIADTKWWYCIFAVAMFIIGWEVIKAVSRRYVVWIKR